MKPNTAVILVNIWKRTGGLEAVNMDIAQAFRSLGWRVKVFSVFGTADDKTQKDYTVKSFCPHGRYPKYIWRHFLWKTIVGWHVRHALTDGDLLIFGHAHLLPLLDLLPEKSAYKKWVWVYGLEVWGSQVLRWRSFLTQLDRMVSISSFTAEQVRSAGVDSATSIVPCCVDTNVFRPTHTPERIRRDEVLICGRMASKSRDKGHEALFKSIPIAEKLLDRQLSVRVIGTGDDQERLEQIARHLVLYDKIRFSGRLPLHDLVEAYQHCGVFCMPSRVDQQKTGYWNGEGFGIVYVEAAACARPVLASTDGGAPETILPGKTGLLVDPRSPESIGQGIAEILRNPLRADEMGRQGRLLATSRFSKEQFQNNVRKLIELCGF